VSEPLQLTDAQRAAVKRRVRDCLALAENALQRRIAQPRLRFDLRGAAAGQFRGGPEGAELRFNSQLFARYFDDNLEHTVAHEVAHHVVFELHGRDSKKRRVRPHGSEWRAIMTLFGVPAEVRHSYDLAQIAVRRERRVRYHCGCQEHSITLRTHHKMAQGQQRACIRCGRKLRRTSE
jgi:SprT protein